MSQSTANCTKCGIKHSRPVGVRCKRLLNVSAPVTESHSSMDSDSFIAPNQLAAQQHVSGSTSSSSKQSATSTSSVAATKMEAKLDLILKRMDELESKNQSWNNRLASKRQQGDITFHTARQRNPIHVPRLALIIIPPSHRQSKRMTLTVWTHQMTTSQQEPHILAFLTQVMIARCQIRSP